MFKFLRVVTLGTRSHGFDYRRFHSTIKPIFLLPIPQDDLWVPIRHIRTVLKLNLLKSFSIGLMIYVSIINEFFHENKIKFIS